MCFRDKIGYTGKCKDILRDNIDFELITSMYFNEVLRGKKFLYKIGMYKEMFDEKEEYFLFLSSDGLYRRNKKKRKKERDNVFLHSEDKDCILMNDIPDNAEKKILSKSEREIGFCVNKYLDKNKENYTENRRSVLYSIYKNILLSEMNVPVHADLIKRCNKYFPKNDLYGVFLALKKTEDVLWPPEIFNLFLPEFVKLAYRFLTVKGEEREKINKLMKKSEENSEEKKKIWSILSYAIMSSFHIDPKSEEGKDICRFDNYKEYFVNRFCLSTTKKGGIPDA